MTEANKNVKEDIVFINLKDSGASIFRGFITRTQLKRIIDILSRETTR